MPNSLGASQAPTTGAPLPCGDALVAYEKPKQEKICAENESGYKMVFEMNLKAGSKIVGN